MQAEQKPAFVGLWIPAALWFNKSITQTEKLLLAFLRSYDSGDGCYASNETLAQQMGSTPESIRVMISRLKSRKFIFFLPDNGKYRRIRTVMYITESVMGITETVMYITDSVGLQTGVKIPEENDLEESVPPREYKKNIRRVQPPIVPQGGRKKTKPTYVGSDRAIRFSEEWWNDSTKPKPVGKDRVKAKSKELQELDGLFDSGVSEDQIRNAFSLLKADTYRSAWVASFSAIAKNWQKIYLQCNGSLCQNIPKLPEIRLFKTPAEMWQDYDEFQSFCQRSNMKCDMAPPTCPRP